MEITFLTLEEVLIIHADQIDRYGGSSGIRDIHLLESALAVVQAGFAGVQIHQDLFEMAGAYLFHIVKNHPFIDGNKRTGLATALVFLDLNGYDLDMEDDLLYQLVLEVVENRADKGVIIRVFREGAKPHQEYGFENLS
jgi:death-on-curing protein